MSETCLSCRWVERTARNLTWCEKPANDRTDAGHRWRRDHKRLGLPPDHDAPPCPEFGAGRGTHYDESTHVTTGTHDPSTEQQ